MGIIEWIAAITGIAGAILLAANVSWSRYGFVLFLCSSITWSWVAYTTVQPALLANQVVFMAINLLGIWRWLLQPSLRSPRADRA